MTILEKIDGKFDEGAYGVVFFDADGNAIKVFKKSTGLDDREHVEKVFNSEVVHIRLQLRMSY